METRVETREADLFTVIRERQSIRGYDPNVQISEQELREMIEEAVLAPSSSNLQPWRFLVVQDPAVKAKLQPIANNQKQVTESSATVVLLGDTEAYRNADVIYDRAVEAGLSKEFRDSYVPRIKEYYTRLTPEAARSIALIDGGLVAMQFMLVAKARGYDTVPMGGFSPEKLIEEFDIPSRYVPVMLISVGKGAAPGFPKARLTVDEVTFWNRLDGIDR
ncbi:nitroreductase family protein [Paenibacillus flagellatus]|uniref:Nitroreductase family protein n=1 Tax=Paenibacillus flagellatus TaxID=2211139 RepID=A0A2V5JXL0_9BACL|nr:nitroreductase family protein [Paenibacillus flagellatus]PYI51002.1 nitroreductase family protein [Paenibacillus flagellatus]